MSRTTQISKWKVLIALALGGAASVAVTACTNPVGVNGRFTTLGSTAEFTFENPFTITLHSHTRAVTISPAYYTNDNGCDNKTLAPGSGECTVVVTQATATPQSASITFTTDERIMVGRLP